MVVNIHFKPIVEGLESWTTPMFVNATTDAKRHRMQIPILPQDETEELWLDETHICSTPISIVDISGTSSIVKVSEVWANVHLQWKVCI